MNVDVVFLPDHLRADELRATVVVFDVLRATTSIVAALEAGVADVRVFSSTDEAARAAAKFDGPKLLCGERNCLAPPGFDLGNSPRAFDRDRHHGRTIFMCTTNGTRAIIAARQAELVLVGSLVNASAVARRCIALRGDVTLLCAGTHGAIAMEDVLGAGAVCQAILGAAPEATMRSDAARIALRLFQASRDRLPDVLRESAGGRNVIAAGLDPDIDYAARLDAVDRAPVCAAGSEGSLVIRNE